MKILSSIDQVSLKNWNDFVLGHPFGNYFQTIEFIKFISNLSNYKPLNLFAINSSDEICGVLCGCITKSGNGIKGALSRRIIIWGGPLIRNQSAEIIEKLFNYLTINYSKKNIYIEFRNSFDTGNLLNVFKSYNFQYYPYVNMVLNIENKTLVELMSKMTYNRRREIKQSLFENANYREAISIEEVEKVYLLLKELYKSKVNLPLPKFEFFKYFFNEKSSKVFVVLHEGNIIGGAFCKLFSNKIIYTWYYSGLRDYKKKIYPTHLAVLAAIDYAVLNGFCSIDFMGGGILGSKYGVRDYKLQFGTDQIEHGRFIRINNRFLYAIGKFAIRIRQSKLLIPKTVNLYLSKLKPTTTIFSS